MIETAIVIGYAFLAGWFCAVTSGALFAWIVFRTKREAHERFLPAAPRKSKGPIVIDEFASEASKNDDAGLPDVVKQMNAKMGAELARTSLKGGRA